MSATQPITFLSHENQNQATSSASQLNDIVMGSFTNSPFNPASYTRKFLESPQTWKAGSFGSRFYPGCSPGQLLGPLDPTDFKTTRLSSSIESDRGSLLNALNIVGREEDMCRDYTCCGLQLNDLHALVEHFEECHVVVWDPRTGNYNTPIIPYPTTQPGNGYYAPQGPFDPDDMEMEMDHSSGPSSSGSSPPDTPIHTPLLPYPTSAFDTTTVLPSRSGLSVNAFSSASRRNKRGVEQTEVLSAYARAKEYALALTSADDQEGILVNGRSGTVTPSLLLSTGTTPANSPDGSRVSSPTLSSPTYLTGNLTATMTSSQSTSRTNSISSTVSRPTSSLLVNKPFKCPKPNCNKSYKQANGLKYHMTHGSCNFTPCKEGEMLKEGMSDSEVREIEKRLRPYACGVGDCARRYKNMNGLRYHYQHSGEHGALGLALLASGQHECLIGKRSNTLNAARQQQQQQQQHQQQETHVIPHHPPPTDLSHQNFYQPSHVTMQPQQAQPFSMTMWGSVNHP